LGEALILKMPPPPPRVLQNGLGDTMNREKRKAELDKEYLKGKKLHFGGREGGLNVDEKYNK
jgi:hypothetical protein